MKELPHRLNRTIAIEAPREIVFEFFTDPARWASWWGEGSTIDPRPGGRAFIRYPGGTEVSGEVVEIAVPERLVFTYGFVSGSPMPPGTSRVTIRLEPAGNGTRLHLLHEFEDPGVRDDHVQGWRFQLSLFANAVANRLHAGAAVLVDRWFDVWADADTASRGGVLASIADPDVTFRDRYSCVTGLDDLSAHIAASQRFMPGIRLSRNGDVRHCQGTVLADWTAVDAAGNSKATGSNVFTLNAQGRIASVVGLWNQ
jgi:uncharacterized protein YndB with AHSA1/START domain